MRPRRPIPSASEFRETVADYLARGGDAHEMDAHFQVIPGWAELCARGKTLPHPLIQRQVLEWIEKRLA